MSGNRWGFANSKIAGGLVGRHFAYVHSEQACGHDPDITDPGDSDSEPCPADCRPPAPGTERPNGIARARGLAAQRFTDRSVTGTQAGTYATQRFTDPVTAVSLALGPAARRDRKLARASDSDAGGPARRSR